MPARSGTNFERNFDYAPDCSSRTPRDGIGTSGLLGVLRLRCRSLRERQLRSG